MPSDNLVDASKEDKPKNKKILRGEKAKKALSKATSKDTPKATEKKDNLKASDVQQKMYGRKD